MVKRESYQGDGLLHAKEMNPDSTYFSYKFPYGIRMHNNLLGFNTRKIKNTVYATGLWSLDIKTQSVSHFSFPETHRFESLVSIMPAPDSSLTIVGLSSDSVVKVLHFDTTITVYPIFNAPANICAVHYINNIPEIVFGRHKKLVGSIASINDSTINIRKYELPSFFDRICNILGAWPENNKWRFLLSTEYHRKNDKWILIGTKNKTNFVVFDERAVYPDLPGTLNKSLNEITNQFDYSISGLIPKQPYTDTLLIFNKAKFYEKIICKPKDFNCIWFNMLGQQKVLTVFESNELNNDEGIFINRLFNAQTGDTIQFVKESDKTIIHQSEKPDSRQIFMSENEFPIAYFKLSKDSNIIITNKLNFSFVNDKCRLLDRQNFFRLVNTTVLRKEPGAMILLDGNFPTMRAITWFILLYGLIPIWILSIVTIWLIEAVRPKPKFAVRERNWTFMMRIMPGSAIYLLFFLFNIYPFLKTFSIFNF